MIRTSNARVSQLIAIAGTLVALAIASLASSATGASPTPADAGARATPCPRATEPASDSSVKVMRKSVRCLINQERAVHGFGRLNVDKSLQRAAQRHTKAMVTTGCLAHRCPNEPNLENRLRQAGYFDGADSWRYAENTGCGLTVEAMVDNWLASLYHRVNILDPDFEDLGIGASKKRVSGRCGKGYGTFVVVFGKRTP